jgi:PleD family two-component response regulator
MAGLLSSPRFLVVDDFESMRKTVRSNLLGMGFDKIFLAADGAEAIKYLKESPVDCIISDWNMPNVTGIELLQFVRSTPSLQNIPFMLVTAEVETSSVTKAIEEGVSEFLIKPFTPAALRAKVKYMVESPAKQCRNRGPQKVVPSQDVSEVVSSEPVDKRRATILVVDDVASNIDVISGILKGTYQVKVANSGENALRIAQTEPQPNLILLDVMMPEMDGMEVCRRLKENEQTEHIPVIFLTAKSDITDMTEGFKNGAVDYITKPANPAILNARVNTHIQLSKSYNTLKDKLNTVIENSQLRSDVERMTRHDIKNPLAAIINTSEILLDNGELAGSEQTTQLEIIRKSSYDMLNMINRSLDLYKMEVGTYVSKAKVFDLAITLNNVVRDCRINAKGSDVVIQYTAPESCMVNAESLLCFTLFSNLIKNAVEASPKKGVVKVFIQKKSNVSVSIHNMGVIPEDIRDTFFEKYSTSGKEGGTGLGTYSAKLMATVQKASIVVKSDQKTGTTITTVFKEKSKKV